MFWIRTALSSYKSNPRSRSLIRWGYGGWLFFIAENAILSENRTTLIGWLGNDDENNYHTVYGTMSTIATASIGYAYYRIRSTYKNRTMPSNLLLETLHRRPSSLVKGFTGFVFMSTGLIIAAQAIPNMQIPIAMKDENSSSSSSSSSIPITVRCPFDFSGDSNQNSSRGTVGWDGNVHGLDRISRHPSLWSFGLIGAAQAVLAPTIPQRIWWLGPAAVAWLGGAHQDSRFRRGMGGTLSPHYESLTSNVPFVAMITGKQGPRCWENLWKETKPLNAVVAVAASTLWILKRMR